MLSDKFFFTIVGALFIVTVTHIVGLSYFLYWRFFWLDWITHFLGGFWIGGISLWALFSFSFFKKFQFPARVPLLVFATLMGVTIGLFWEIYEVLLGFGPGLLISAKEYYADMLLDLFFDIFGAAAAAFVFFFFRRERISGTNIL